MDNILLVYLQPIYGKALPVGLRTNVNYSYFKFNILLLIRKN